LRFQVAVRQFAAYRIVLEVNFRPQVIYYPDLSGLSGERSPPLEKKIFSACITTLNVLERVKRFKRWVFDIGCVTRYFQNAPERLQISFAK